MQNCVRAVQDQTESDLVPFSSLALSPTAHCNLLQQPLEQTCYPPGKPVAAVNQALAVLEETATPAPAPLQSVPSVFMEQKQISEVPLSLVSFIMGASLPTLDADTLQRECAGEGGQLGGEKQVCTHLINSGMA